MALMCMSHMIFNYVRLDMNSLHKLVINAGSTVAGLSLVSVAALSIGLATARPASAAVTSFDYSGSNSSSNQTKFPTWVGNDLAHATEIDLHGNQWAVTNQADPNDAAISGFTLSTPIELTSQGLLLTPEVLTWDDGFVLGANNPNGHDSFTMTLTAITSHTLHGSGDGSSINVDFSGVVNDQLGLFVNDAATFDIFALDTFVGNNKIGIFNFSAASDGISLTPPVIVGGDPSGGAPATPEAATWLMIGIGLVSMAWMGKRRTNRLAVTL